jgi:hypothetical protein
MKSQRKVGEIVITDSMYLWAVAMMPVYKKYRAKGYSIEFAAVCAAGEASNNVNLTVNEMADLRTLIKENRLIEILNS